MSINRAMPCLGRSTGIRPSTHLPLLAVWAASNGRLEVNEDGRRLIATGLAEGRNTRIVLDADPKKAGRWAGKLKVKQQGQSITLDYRVDLVSPTRLKGKMVGKLDVGGQKCTLSRNFTLTRRGK